MDLNVRIFCFGEGPPWQCWRPLGLHLLVRGGCGCQGLNQRPVHAKHRFQLFGLFPWLDSAASKVEIEFATSSLKGPSGMDSGPQYSHL